MASALNKTLVASLLVSVSVMACSVGPDYKRPATDAPMVWPWQQDQHAPQQDGASVDVIALDWWRSFHDPALDALIAEGLQANADLLVAASRVAQARAMLTIREADLYPSLGSQAGASRTANSEESALGAGGSTRPYNDFSLGMVLNYELDLWGRLRRANESARAQLLSVKANRDAIRLAVISNIATGYFNLRALDAQIAITDQTIASRQDALEFQRKQYDVGGENALTYHQAEAELADAQARKPALEQARTEQETALSVLLGRSPRALVEQAVARVDSGDSMDETGGKTLDEISAVPQFPAEMPSTLLTRRPDIYEAEQNLVSANADIGVARADYFPRLSLSALLGLNAMEADNLFSSSARRWQVGAAASVPLVDFGKRRASVESAEAARDAALARYAQTVRTAFKEVVDAMSAEKTSAAREEADARQLASRAETLRLSDIRYKSGYSNYLEVLDAQRFLYQAQMARVTARRDRLVAMVNLYRSLGGGWHSGEEPAPVVAIEPVRSDELSGQPEPVVADVQAIQEPVETSVEAMADQPVDPFENSMTVVPEADAASSTADVPAPEPVLSAPRQVTPPQEPMQPPHEMMD